MRVMAAMSKPKAQSSVGNAGEWPKSSGRYASRGSTVMPLSFSQLLSVGVVAQDGLGVRQHGVGRGDASAGQAQPALVDQAAQPLVLAPGCTANSVAGRKGSRWKRPGAAPARARARLARRCVECRVGSIPRWCAANWDPSGWFRRIPASASLRRNPQLGAKCSFPRTRNYCAFGVKLRFILPGTPQFTGQASQQPGSMARTAVQALPATEARSPCCVAG